MPSPATTSLAAGSPCAASTLFIESDCPDVPPSGFKAENVFDTSMTERATTGRLGIIGVAVEYRPGVTSLR